MYPKDPVPDGPKTDIIYHWKCTRHHHICAKHPKAELKDSIVIDRESSTLHHQAKEALHIHIKDPSLNSNIGKVRIPQVFNKLLNPHGSTVATKQLHPFTQV